MVNQNLQHAKTSAVHHHRPETTETSEIEDPGTSTETETGAGMIEETANDE